MCLAEGQMGVQLAQVGRTGTDSSWMLRDTWWLVLELGQNLSLARLCSVLVLSELQISASPIRNLYIRHVRQI